jgi:hypothetical protein
MRSKLIVSLVVATAAAVVVAVAAFATNGTAQMSHTSGMHMQAQTSAAALTRSDLRVLLDKQLGEHAVLAMNATNLGVKGSPAFAAAAKALDRNSVALSKSIASVYGAQAGRVFLNGPFMWRAHIKFFVDYTVATAKKNKAAKARAVANLQTYTVKFGDFLAGATGLPKLAVRNDLLGHVLELKGQLDAYAAGNYGLAAVKYHAAYEHMIMTGDLLAGAIAKQKNLT